MYIVHTGTFLKKTCGLRFFKESTVEWNRYILWLIFAMHKLGFNKKPCILKQLGIFSNDLHNFWCFQSVSKETRQDSSVSSFTVLKSDNLQYNTLVRWDKWLIDQASDVPSIIFFFIISCKNSLQKLFQFIFECPKSLRNYEKNNAWNIRRLVDESFVPSTQRIILKIVGFQALI